MRVRYALFILFLAGCAGPSGIAPAPSPTRTVSVTPEVGITSSPPTASTAASPAPPSGAAPKPVEQPPPATADAPPPPEATPRQAPGNTPADQPPSGASWQVQYTGPLTTAGARIVDIDGADSSKEVVSQIRSAGGYAVCYFNAGAFEDWRSDASRYPAQLLGRSMAGWPRERWVDIRRLDELMPILEQRMDLCRSKGFQAIDPDNVDGWAHDTGFDLTRTDSIRLVRALAEAAHARGLAIGLKNSIEIIGEVVDTVDFAVNEQCLAHGECGAYQPFLDRGKAVLHVEYEGSEETVCRARPEGFSTVIKDQALGAERVGCP